MTAGCGGAMGHMVETTGRSFDLQSRHCCEGVIHAEARAGPCSSRSVHSHSISTMRCFGFQRSKHDSLELPSALRKGGAPALARLSGLAESPL